MTYEINPCEACWKKFQDGNCNINDLNNCIVDTTTAFANFPSNNTMSGNLAGQNWHDCIKEKMKTLPKQAGGKRDFCNFQLNVAPAFIQVPHFFPQFLSETGNKEKALQLALEECKDSKYPNECIITAHTDYNAIITKEKFSNDNTQVCRCPDGTEGILLGPDDNDKIKDGCSCTPKQNQLVKSDPPPPPPPPPGPTFEDVAKQDPFVFWPFFIGWSIIFAIMLVIFIKTLVSNKK